MIKKMIVAVYILSYLKKQSVLIIVTYNHQCNLANRRNCHFVMALQDNDYSYLVVSNEGAVSCQVSSPKKVTPVFPMKWQYPVKWLTRGNL